jgi:Ni/Fe-hydrogenase subunit HybB-like protein
MKSEDMKDAITEEVLLRPLLRTGKRTYVFLAILLAGIAWLLYAWRIQLTSGLVVTGMRDLGTMGGVPWGIYMTNFIFFIGITHAGIAIASAIRLLNKREYLPIARIAELTTIFSLIVAGLSILFDIGRPDRIFKLIIYYPERIGPSPIIWDITAIATYLVFSITYLYVEMREDIVRIMGKVKFRRLYELLLPMHDKGERIKIKRIVRWASLFNFPVMVMVHTTVAWIFGLMGSRPGWYGAIMGPYYVAGAVLSGVATVIVISAIYRQIFKWHNLINQQIFRGLGRFLSWVTIIYLYFIFAELLTARYAGPASDLMVSDVLFRLEYSLHFWLQVGALCVAFIIYFLPSVYPKAFRIWSTVFASVLVVATLWVTRFLIVIPSLTRPHLPYLIGSYTPTWVEWSLVAGTFAIIILLFTLFTKVLPIIPITEMKEE